MCIKRKMNKKKEQQSLNVQAVRMQQLLDDQPNQPVYANLGADKSSSTSPTEIPLDQIQIIYNSMMSQDALQFREEFQKLKTEAESLSYPTTVASAKEVMSKNRYKNILPNDNTRVVLGGEGETSYINASYVDGYGKSKKFIATQGPLPATLRDFWRMVVEKNCRRIVMLTKCQADGKVKSEKYWPDKGLSVQYGAVKVENTTEKHYGSFCVREFRVTKDDKELDVFHFHFVGWPDHSVPITTTNLVQFYKTVMEHQHAEEGPVVVHCSAGAGRSGAFIAYDYVLEECKDTGMLDIYKLVLNLRHQRVDMVQTLEQYILVHKLILEWHLLGDTSINAEDLNDATLGDAAFNEILKTQFSKLSLVGPVNQMKFGDMTRHKDMNRKDSVIPYEKSKVTISMQKNELNEPYVNASKIESTTPALKLFAAQGPMENTCIYFWRAVMDNDVDTIIMLTSCVEKGKEQCFQYWPESSDTDITLKSIRIHLESEKNLDDQTVERTISLHRDGNAQIVTQYQYTEWAADETPAQPDKILDLVSKLHKSSDGGGQTVAMIHCSDGAGRTGAFCAVVNAIGRLQYEDRIDIFREVKDLRDNRPGMVKTFEQYLFCHQAVCKYRKSNKLDSAV